MAGGLSKSYEDIPTGFRKGACPICLTDNTDLREEAIDSMTCNCARCGKFYLNGRSYSFFLQRLFPETEPTASMLRRSVVSHAIRLRQRPGRYEFAPINIEEISSLCAQGALPNAQEQVDNLVLWVGDHLRYPAEFTFASKDELSAWIGIAVTPRGPYSGLVWLIEQPETKALVVAEDGGQSEGRPQLALRLSMPGWGRYQELKHQRVDSRAAFIAMKFGDPELNGLVDDHFRPAVARAGFELRLLTDSQPAGLIDDQIRVGLRRARFVIADLTHGNRGAYWEAGFAEALGRPVIYTCRADAWERRDGDGDRLVHFDTNHLVTVMWDPANPEDAANRLTATIRATLPDEATLADEWGGPAGAN